jgi:hypothetical protein
MQSLSQIGNARREERVLLPALIELRSEHGDEALAADGIDVSPSGLAVRAAFVPEVGTRLVVSFRCPPDDDAVQGLGEVVWASWDSPRSGSFGIRFLELDTKSAKAIRRFVAPDAVSVEQPLAPRAATMRIAGVGAPIEADVRLYDKSCIVLEQELSFLRLGRGIEVDVPGRGVERGRIASIELRQGPLDTPTLVFGVLLDEKRVEVAAPSDPSASRTADRTDPAHEHAFLDSPPGRVSRPLELAASVAVASAERRKADEPQVVRMRASEPPGTSTPAIDEDDELERALTSRMPELLAVLGKGVTACLAWLRGTLVPTLRTALHALRSLLGPRAPGEPELHPSRVLLALARLRAGMGAGWTQLAKRLQRRRTTAPAPRVQRSPASVRPQQRPEPPPRPVRSKRWLTVGLAALGVGLGVYALAPRSGADRIRVPRAEPALLPAQAAEASAGEALELSTPTVTALHPSGSSPAAEPPAPTGSVRGLAPLPADAPEPGAANTRFGEANVPNGRVFALRMSGPVKSLEGETREDGFSVRIPGRLALDRASPIATSHRAVARALILNRGEYAELTLEFLPGMRPKYQVVAKESSIEITLERI